MTDLNQKNLYIDILVTFILNTLKSIYDIKDLNIIDSKIESNIVIHKMANFDIFIIIQNFSHLKGCRTNPQRIYS